MRCFLLFWLSVGLSVTVLATLPVAAEGLVGGVTGQGNARARELFRLGTNAYKAGRVEEARQLLDEAWSLHQSYDVAATLGQVEFEAGNVVRANALFDLSIQNFPPIESDDKLAKLHAIRDRARLSVAELSVQCDCAGAELRVDDVLVAAMPLSQALYLLPGSHWVSLRQGQATARVLVEVIAGQRYPVELKLVEPKPLQSTVQPETNLRASKPVPPTNNALPAWPIYAGAGGAALGVAAAIAFNEVSRDAGHSAEALRDKLGSTSVCSDPTSASAAERSSCGQLSDAVSEERDYARFGWYAIGVATTSAVASVAYWIWRDVANAPADKGRALRPSLSWAMSLEPDAASLRVQGTF